MKKKNAGAEQVNQYDKILRENMEAALPGLIKNLLGIQAIYTEELPDDIQHTKERKPDVLKKVTDKTGRMQFNYALITLSAVDYNLLLASDTPEEKMLAILADFGKGDPRRAVESIVKQVIENSEGDFSKLRRINQLRVMAQLRNLAPENLAIMDDLTGYFTVEKDIFYMMGERDGLKKGEEKMEESRKELVRNLLRNTDFSISRIACLVNVSQYYVRKIKKTLNKPTAAIPSRRRA